MLKIDYHNKFKKDFKLIKKRGYNLNKLNEVVRLLVNEQPLPKQYLDHSLNGEYDGCRKCHIQPDWLLIYNNTEDIPRLYRRRGIFSRSAGVQSPAERKQFFELPLLVKSRALKIKDKELTLILTRTGTHSDLF